MNEGDRCCDMIPLTGSAVAGGRANPMNVGGRCRFGVFEFDETTLELTKSGRPVALRPQALKLLALLLADPGAIVPRDRLQRALWPDDTFVDFEQGVNHAIRELRSALGDTADSPRFVQTLPRRGYRFIPPVERVASANVAALTPPVPDPAGEPSVDETRTKRFR